MCMLAGVNEGLLPFKVDDDDARGRRRWRSAWKKSAG